MDNDRSLMMSAGITTIRIAESTWSTLDLQLVVSDFSHVDRVLEAAGRFGIQVILGTSTHAVPRLARRYASRSWTLPTRPTAVISHVAHNPM